MRVLVRNEKQKLRLIDVVDDVFAGQITNIRSLTGLMDDIDIVMSSVGITRQKDNLTYMDVDFGANLNLLKLAEEANVAKFLYVSVLNAKLLAGIKIIEAKEKFVSALELSPIISIIIRPNGFFLTCLNYYQWLRMAALGLLEEVTCKLVQFLAVIYLKYVLIA